MTVRIKICGLREEAGWDAAVEAGADWLGLNFFPRSPRFLTPAEAGRLAARGTGGAGLVGLFVAPFEDAAVRAVLDAVPLAALQIYGPVAGLRERFGMPVWPAIGVGTEADLPRAAPRAERLLIEAKPPRGATRPGGNAATFDWRIMRGWKAPVPWTLAGGLTPDNVAEAIRISGATAVDVSSGVERTPGVKDPMLIRTFAAVARAADDRTLASSICGNPFPTKCSL